LKDGSTLGPDLQYLSKVDGARSVEPERRMVVLMVVVVEELFAEDANVLDAVELVGERGAVLQRLELRLRVGIVVALTG
jgi:hypothetical protein